MAVQRDDFVSTQEAARTLGVTARHVRRLADRGELTKAARGLVDRGSLERYLREQRHGRTRSWAEHTAWGAIALLDGHSANWLGATQASRVRRTLREMTEPNDLLVRTRDRARARTYSAHTSALPRLRGMLAIANLARLGIVDAGGDTSVDGYLAADLLEPTVRSLGLRADAAGNVILRVTGFDFGMVSDLVTGSAIVAALDSATSLDPRVRGVGKRALTEMLDEYR